jgi:hypothetical protein
MSIKSLCLAGVSLFAFAAPALAHHSFAMFDQTKTVEMQGTVKEFQWTNPHSWLIVNVVDPQGKEVVWSLEMGGPGGLARNGWRPKTLSPGDKVTFKAHPLRSGEPGGQFQSVVLPDGKVMGE